MARPWRDIDWQAPRPDERHLQESRSRLRYVPVEAGGQAVRHLTEHLRRGFVNGAVLLQAFDAVDVDQTCHWFLSRNRFDEYGFFEHFLRSEAVREVFPDLVRGHSDHFPTFNPSAGAAYALDGFLASLLMSGGAYEQFEGSGSEAKDLTSAAVAELVGEQYEDFAIYHSFDAWSEWFYDVAWDTTGVLIDLIRNRIVLLAMTDTD